MKSPWIALVVLSPIVLSLAVLAFANGPPKKHPIQPAKSVVAPDHIVKTDAEWRKQLTPEQYRVLREKGTELAFTGKYWDLHAKGTYLCAACGYELFSSRQKFDSGTGWPSFWQPSITAHVSGTSGRSADMWGQEVTCARCGGHLGHVFSDGPQPTGLRYCINSAALTFSPAK